MSIAEMERAAVQAQPPARDTRARHRWTVADYHKMGEVGLLSEDERVELIEGEIIEMAPIGSGHASSVKHLNRLFSLLVSDKAIVSVQDPIVLADRAEPQPDLAILKWRGDYYKSAHPQAEDVLLLIEVADTTARYDREVKVPLYARHGIPEVWLFDLTQPQLEVYRNPVDGQYARVDEHRAGRIAPECFPEAVIDLAELFPRP